MATVLALLSQALLLLLLAPLAWGLPAWLVARLGGHAAAPPWQEYYDLRAWLRRSGGSARAASLALGATLTAGLLTPTVVRQAPLEGSGDLIVLAGLLMVANLALSALRGRATWPSPAEPILLLAFLALAISLGTTSAPLLAGAGGIGKHPAELPLFLAVGCLVLADQRRLVWADAAVGVGAYGLGVSRAANYFPGGTARLALLVRRMVLLSLLANLFLPWGLGNADHDSLPRLIGGGVLFLLRLTVLACLIAWIDTRLPVAHGDRARLLILALSLAVLGLLTGGLSHA